MKKRKVIADRATKSRLGRPPKAEQERTLEKYGWVIAEELRLHPLRQMIDAQFAPYYERVRKGDLRAIYDYCDRVAPRLEPSFYELVGFLVTLRFYAVANQVLLGIERRGSMGRPSDRETYDYWYRTIKPLFETARQFIRAAHKSDPDANRTEIWRDYVSQPLPTVRYTFIAGKADAQLRLHSLGAPVDEQFRPFLERILAGDAKAKADFEQMLQEKQNRNDNELRRSAIEELLK